jgi:anthranilate synthase component 2
MKIVVVDNFDSFVFNLVRYLKEIPSVELIIQRNNRIDYRQMDECDAILLSPGPGIPSEAGELMEVIQKYHRTKAILGVCLGHQAIGEFFGAQLIPCTTPVHGKSSNIAIINCSSLFHTMEQSVQVGRYHSWQISEVLPSELVATAITQNGEIMGIKHGEFAVEGIQFHPQSIKN